jgi:hypothetical protein
MIKSSALKPKSTTPVTTCAACGREVTDGTVFSRSAEVGAACSRPCHDELWKKVEETP